MNNINLPSIPQLPPGTSDPRVCEIVQHYLAVWNDLTPEQQQAVSAHLRICANCVAMQQSMRQATSLIATLEASSPSARVDQAVTAAIAARSNGHSNSVPGILQARRTAGRAGQQRNTFRLVGLLVAAAVILLATFATIQTVKVTRSPEESFMIPATISWSAYVLYHTQTKVDEKGKRYRVMTYHDLGSNRLNVETVMDGILDVVLIDDGHSTLAMDEMHHVAQRNVNGWIVNQSDESMFDLNIVRGELNTHRATYLGEDQFRGQAVYRIRCDNGLVLLLDMHYKPVNVLTGAVGPGTGEPIYDTLQLLSPSQVPTSMWNMSVPNGFKMGMVSAQL